MKISKKISKTPFYAITSLILIVAVGWISYAYAQGQWPFTILSEGQSDSENVDYSPATDEEVKAGEETAEQNENNKKSDNNFESTDEQADATGPQTGTAGTVSITVASQQDNIYQIRTLIVTSNKGGTCTLTVHQNGVGVHSERVQTQMVAGNSTCKGFDFDTANIPAGDYRATVTYSNDTGSTSAYEDITIK